MGACWHSFRRRGNRAGYPSAFSPAGRVYRPRRSSASGSARCRAPRPRAIASRSFPRFAWLAEGRRSRGWRKRRCVERELGGPEPANRPGILDVHEDDKDTPHPEYASNERVPHCFIRGAEFGKRRGPGLHLRGIALIERGQRPNHSAAREMNVPHQSNRSVESVLTAPRPCRARVTHLGDQQDHRDNQQQLRDGMPEVRRELEE